MLQKQAELTSEISACQKGIADAKAQKETLKGQQTTINARQKAIGSGTLETGEDSVLEEWLQIHRSILSDDYVDPCDDEQMAWDHCKKVYKAWAGGSHGLRTLRSLAELLWNDSSSLRGSVPLKSQHLKFWDKQADAMVYRSKKMALEPEINTVMTEVQSRDIVPDQSDPEWVTSPPLLQFQTAWWQLLSRPIRFWGEAGDRTISGTRGEQVLSENEQQFTTQIWKEPWHVDRYFDFRALRPTIWTKIESKAFSIWLEQLDKNIADITDQDRELDRQIIGLEETRKSHGQELAKLNADIEQEREARSDLKLRIDESNQLLETVRDFSRA